MSKISIFFGELIFWKNKNTKGQQKNLLVYSLNQVKNTLKNKSHEFIQEFVLMVLKLFENFNY